MIAKIIGVALILWFWLAVMYVRGWMLHGGDND